MLSPNAPFVCHQILRGEILYGFKSFASKSNMPRDYGCAVRCAAVALPRRPAEVI
jgi:hypothetical protein